MSLVQEHDFTITAPQLRTKIKQYINSNLTAQTYDNLLSRLKKQADDATQLMTKIRQAKQLIMT
jgi:hypothetical protein